MAARSGQTRRTNNNIGSQVRAAEALERIFALNIDKNDLLKRQLEGRPQEELEFYVVHGYLPHQEPKLADAAPPPQLPESTAGSVTPEPLSTLSTDSITSTEFAVEADSKSESKGSSDAQSAGPSPQ